MGKSAGDEVDMRCATFVLLKRGKKSFKTLSNLFFFFFFQDRFTEIFGKGMSTRSSGESLKRWLFVGVALVTGLLVGMLMTD